jgi:hypothetical protein
MNELNDIAERPRALHQGSALGDGMQPCSAQVNNLALATGTRNVRHLIFYLLAEQHNCSDARHTSKQHTCWSIHKPMASHANDFLLYLKPSEHAAVHIAAQNAEIAGHPMTWATTRSISLLVTLLHSRPLWRRRQRVLRVPLGSDCSGLPLLIHSLALVRAVLHAVHVNRCSPKTVKSCHHCLWAAIPPDVAPHLHHCAPAA